MKRLLSSEAMGKSSYTAITVERRSAADWVTLNRPDGLNALDHAMVEDLLDYFGSAVEDPARRVIVLRGPRLLRRGRHQGDHHRPAQ